MVKGWKLMLSKEKEGVRDADHANDAALVGNEDRRFGVRLQRFDMRVRLSGDIARAAHTDQLAVDGGADAAPRLRLKALRLSERQIFGFRRLDHRLTERMFAASLDVGREAQHVIRAEVASSDDIGDRRFAFGDGSGFVEGDNLQAMRVFQRLAVLKQDAHLRAAPGADHNGRRRGEA